MTSPPLSSVFCPACGQALTIPLHDLAARFTCPRCQTWHTVGDFAERRQLIVVSPVMSSPPAALASPAPAMAPPEYTAPPVHGGPHAFHGASM